MSAAVNGSPLVEAQDLSVEAGIRQVYLDAVGRSPVQEEINVWKRNFGNGLPFHEFMLLMRSGPEAVKQAERTSIMHGCGDAECIQRAFELVLGRAELVEQIEGLVDGPVGARARPVHLVHHHDRLQPQRQRALQHLLFLVERRVAHRQLEHEPVIGVIGGDLLYKYEAIIDYKKMVVNLNLNSDRY